MAKLTHCIAALRLTVVTVDPTMHGVDFLVSPKDRVSFDTFLRRVSEKIILPHNTGAIRGLYDKHVSMIHIVLLCLCRFGDTFVIYFFLSYLF